MVEVRVPATSANMGAGFDTLGIALGIYNIIKVEEIDSGLKIINKREKEFIPVNENNLIYKSLMRVFNEVGYKKRGISIVQESNIPVTRGLGSSSACIVGGLLAGNVLSGRKLSYERMLELAVEMEGHPDNAVPAMYGGFCISACDGGKIFKRSFKMPSNIRYAVMIPDYFVATKKSRGLLPEEIPLKNASHNISRAVWLAANLAIGNFEDLRIGVEDKIHQPYRKNYVDSMEEIFAESYENGSKATFLSGSGPTILSILDKNFYKFKNSMENYFQRCGGRWKCRIVEVDNVGAIVREIK